jgi:hypothetical protein
MKRSQQAHQFRILSFIGGGASVVGVGVVGISQFLAIPAAAIEVFVVLAVVGLIVSAIALVFARKSELPFWECAVAFGAASLGVAAPALMILSQFARIMQRLVS